MLKKNYHKIVELGVSDELSETDKRQVRSTNIATILCVFFLISWIPFAFILQVSSIPNIVNLLGIVLFLPIFFLNKSGNRVIAAIWLILISYLFIILNTYLFGYESGVPLIFVILIPLPFLTIPYQKLKLSIGFSLLCCITWVYIVSFNSYFIPHLEGANSYLNLELNATFISLLLLILFYSFSNTINHAEKCLQLEREKSDLLLHNILPQFIAKRLKEKHGLIADGIPMASVLFADLVGFTKLSEKLSPKQLVNQLNEVFSEFDRLLEKYELEKIKTIGDAYMVSGGLHGKKSNHLEKNVNMALEMLDVINNRNISSENKLQIRIGIHVGPVVAGVIGFKKFAYDIWGNTVNLASRLESHGLPGKIHVSEQVKRILDKKIQL